VAYTYNPTTWEAEARGSWVQGHLGPHSKALSQTKQNKTKPTKQTNDKKKKARHSILGQEDTVLFLEGNFQTDQ
jgi:hypothetical protein